jgi:hypothetical protein
MTLGRLFAIGLIAVTSGLNAAQAQSIGDRQTPAEFPPVNFQGNQFVDSRGCVYIRAGLDGATTWVPRVTRDRKVICGFKPTFDAATASTTTAPELGSDVVRIEPAAPPTEKPSLFGNARPTPEAAPVAAAGASVAAVEPTAAAPVSAPKTATVVSTPKAQPTQTSASSVKAAPVKAAPVAAAPSPAPERTVFVNPSKQTERRTTTQAPREAGIVSPCREGVTQYKGSKVRCGPQAQSPVTPGVGGALSIAPLIELDQSSALRPPVGSVVRVGEAAPDVRIVPKHVYELRQTNAVSSHVPEGYRRAFDDGRLDTERAVVTFKGEGQTNQIWSQTVPRRLIEVKAQSDLP